MARYWRTTGSDEPVWHSGIPRVYRGLRGAAGPAPGRRARAAPGPEPWRPARPAGQAGPHLRPAYLAADRPRGRRTHLAAGDGVVAAGAVRATALPGADTPALRPWPVERVEPAGAAARANQADGRPAPPAAEPERAAAHSGQRPLGAAQDPAAPALSHLDARAESGRPARPRRHPERMAGDRLRAGQRGRGAGPVQPARRHRRSLPRRVSLSGAHRAVWRRD